MGELAYEECGSGPPVVLLHGLGRNAADLWPLAQRLQDRFHVVVPDLRGHGRSPDAPWTTRDALDDVQTLLRRRALDRPAVVGHSLGGMLAALLATTPGAVRAAVNLDGHGAGWPSALPGVPVEQLRAARRAAREGGPAQVPAVALTLEQLQAAREAARSAAAGASMDPAHVLAVFDRSFDPDGTYRPSRQRVAEVLDAIEHLDLHAAYRRSTVPLLVVRATRRPDDLVTTAWAAWSAEALADVARTHPQVEVLDLDADHGLVGTATDLVAEHVTGFLLQHAASG